MAPPTDEKRRERGRLCSVIGVHDRGPDDRCRDCGVLLDVTALTCRTVPSEPVIA